MPAPHRFQLRRVALIAFLALDLLGLVALVYDQLFSVESPYLWVVSAVLVLASLPLLVRLADYVLAPPDDSDIIPTTGGKIP